jgi:RNA polymerase sigma-70 factor (ECF subfamily)
MLEIQECWGRRNGRGSAASFREGEADLAAEAALLRAGRAGDHAALERLLALYRRPLFSLCLGILGHPEDAEDAAQETFLRALRALPHFREDAAFRTWLFRIGVNVCLKHKSAHRPTEPWDDEEARQATAASPEVIALRRLRLLEALRQILPRHRAILLLKEREGWSVAEIAAAMRWNPVRVKNELAKARRALVEWRRQEEGEER